MQSPGLTKNTKCPGRNTRIAMLLFSGVSMLLLYVIERVQHVLPWNPQDLANVGTDLAFNTAASFTTNTNWQNYVPRSHHELLHADGRPGVSQLRFRRGRHRAGHRRDSRHRAPRNAKRSATSGWIWCVRSCGCLLPVCLVIALVFVSQGVVQNLQSVRHRQAGQSANRSDSPAPTEKPPRRPLREQVIAQGPSPRRKPSRFSAPTAAAFSTPTARILSKIRRRSRTSCSCCSIFAIPAGLTYTLGRMTGSQRHGWAVWAAMALLFLAGVTAAYAAEARGNPLLHGIDQTASATQPGGNMEGKEVRFGIANSALFATITTDASCGAVNSHARFLHAARRHGSADQHHARRSRLRRRRRRGFTE